MINALLLLLSGYKEQIPVDSKELLQFDSELDLQTRLDDFKSQTKLERFFSVFPGMPYISWYPNFNYDFKSLVYLTPEFYRINRLKNGGMIFPDLYFVSNDLSENQRLRSFSKNEILYQDENLKLIVLEADELNQVRLGKRSKTDGSDVISTDKVKYAQFLIVQVIALNSNKEIGEYNIPILYLDCKAEDLYELAFVKSKLNCSHLLLKNKEQDLTLFSKNKLKSKLKSLSARVVFSEKELGEDVLPLENTYVSESVRKRESNSKPKEKVLKRKIRKVEKKMWPNFGRAELYYY